MCNPMAAIAAVGVVMGGYATYTSQQSAKKAAAQQQSNYISQRNTGILQGFRDIEFKNMSESFAAKQFEIDMRSKTSQLDLNNQEFNQNALFKQQQLAYDLQQHEMQLEAENASELSKIDYAGKTMQNAYDAQKTDMELLNEQWEQINGKNSLDTFERKRQSMKEAASVRVSQGESGIFGNTALKELSNSIMQGTFDTGILAWNLTNAGKQKSAEAKQIKATAASRTNEALSSFTNKLTPGNAMNTAVTSLQI